MHGDRLGTTLHEGGRLSYKLLVANALDIEDVLRWGVTPDWLRTVVRRSNPCSIVRFDDPAITEAS
jgi:hypothetical protein